MRSGRQLVLALALAGLAAPAHADTIRIVIQDLAFAPPDVAARVGDTIEWVNTDVFAHTATARNGDFDVRQPAKTTVTSVLTRPGRVAYYCRFHPNMTGVLTVAP